MGSKDLEPNLKPRYFSIFSTPDGQECLKKVCYGTAYGAMAGTIVSVYDIIGYTGSGTVASGLGRWMFHLFPMAAVGGTYTAVACVSGSMRGKDDQWNHILAGLAAGGIYGIKAQSQKVGWGVGIFLAFCGFATKTLSLHNYPIFPTTVRNQTGFYDYRKSYFTSRPDPEGRPDY